LKVHGKP